MLMLIISICDVQNVCWSINWYTKYRKQPMAIKYYSSHCWLAANVGDNGEDVDDDDEVVGCVVGCWQGTNGPVRMRGRDPDEAGDGLSSSDHPFLVKSTTPSSYYHVRLYALHCTFLIITSPCPEWYENCMIASWHHKQMQCSSTVPMGFCFEIEKSCWWETKELFWQVASRTL